MLNVKSLNLEQTQQVVSLIDDFEENKYEINEEIRGLKKPYGVSKNELLKAVLIGVPVYLIVFVIALVTKIMDKIYYIRLFLDIRTPADLAMTVTWCVIIPLLLFYMIKGERYKRFSSQRLLFNLVQEYEVNENNVVVLKRMVDAISTVPKSLIDKTILDDMVRYKKNGLLQNDEKVIQMYLKRMNEQEMKKVHPFSK
ncbi:hypothetical protein ABC382_00455 [Lysinibacillus sp. 1P01SD]|uniref:hypothetical protein n=1 Tax=Lysinibacillus sp. 1P01SD TaxID=3132285 RepID=UPI0039A1676B